jgi:diguanylate cyclase
VARTILHGIRPYDKAARWGGEEFLLVFPGVALAEAGIVAERVRAHIAALRLPLSDGTEFSVYASMGVASSTMETPLHVGDLISQADTALYQAKHQGRNQVVLFNPNCSNQEQGAPSTFHQI